MPFALVIFLCESIENKLKSQDFEYRYELFFRFKLLRSKQNISNIRKKHWNSQTALNSYKEKRIKEMLYDPDFLNIND